MMPIPPKKMITYGPAPAHLVEAIRVELRRMIEQPNLDDHLGEIGRFANQADDMLMCLKSPEAVMRGEHQITVPGVVASPPNAETYGATIIRTIMEELKEQREKINPVELVASIALARTHGMTDLAGELESKLLGGKKLDGHRPVNSRLADAAATQENLADETVPTNNADGGNDHERNERAGGSNP